MSASERRPWSHAGAGSAGRTDGKADGAEDKTSTQADSTVPTALYAFIDYKRKVVGILDANRADLAKALLKRFPAYHFFAIPTNDVRTKNSIPSKPAVAGLLDDENKDVRPEHIERTKALFNQANRYLLS